MTIRESVSGIFFPMNRVWRARIRVLGLILLGLGAFFAVVSIVYFTVPADSLPGILGRKGASTVRYRRGTAMLILTALSWVLGGVALNRARRSNAGAL